MENVEKDMTPILIEDLGMRYPTETSIKKRRYGLYQCQYCGKEFEAQTPDVKNKKTNSCGCYQKQKTKEANTLHSNAYHPLYATWKSMKTRCYNNKANTYTEYGARGIKICDRWMDVKNFIDDMYPTWKEGLTLDRIDVNGNYEPDNCRWATATTQSQNTRAIRSTNTSGFRGVSECKRDRVWRARIVINNTEIHLGSFHTALEAAKAYERYVRLNNLEHNFTPTLNEDEILGLEKPQELEENKC